MYAMPIDFIKYRKLWKKRLKAEALKTIKQQPYF